MNATSKRRWNLAVAGPLLTAALLAGSLSGCGPAPELDGGAAGQLQSQVLAVTEAAATNDSAGALKLLDELTAKLDTAAAEGQVSFKRHQSIKAAIDAVRADLTAQQAAADKAARDAAAAKKAAADKAAAAARAAAAAAAAKAAAAAAAAAPAPVAPAPAAGKGKPKGKGKGGR